MCTFGQAEQGKFSHDYMAIVEIDPAKNILPVCTSPTAGVFSRHRPETPELGNYGNFWMTSDEQMNDFI